MDPSVWMACAGASTFVPVVGAFVYYFPHGHAEQATSPPVFGPIRPAVLTRVVAVQLLADAETDEVFAKIKLEPIDRSHAGAGAGAHCDYRGLTALFDVKKLILSEEKYSVFWVPELCSESIFPALDCSLDKPAQDILTEDVHGNRWTFRHTYRGKPLRHQLTTGWTKFAKSKNLVAGDSLLFIRHPAGKICVGIRRTSRPGQITDGKLSPESVANAADLAANGKEFEVIHYPKAGRAEFLVPMRNVVGALGMEKVGIKVGTKIRFSWDLEDRDHATVYEGKIDAIIVDSPWRMIQVKWDTQQPKISQLPTRINPWELALSLDLFQSSHPKPANKRPSLPATPSKPYNIASTPNKNQLPTTWVRDYFSDKHYAFDSDGQLQSRGSQPPTSYGDTSLDWTLSSYGMQVAKHHVRPATKSLQLNTFSIDAAQRQAKVQRVVPPETYSFTLNGELIDPNQPKKDEKLDATGDNDAAQNPNQPENDQKLDTATGDNCEDISF